MRYPEPRWYWRYLTDADIQQMKNSLSLCSTEQVSDKRSPCYDMRKALDEGGYYYPDKSVALYLFLNAIVAVAGFGIIFGLTYLLPAIARRYWRWLNT
jgi:hypothetical protein